MNASSCRHSPNQSSLAFAATVAVVFALVAVTCVAVLATAVKGVLCRLSCVYDEQLVFMTRQHKSH